MWPRAYLTDYLPIKPPIMQAQIAGGVHRYGYRDSPLVWQVLKE